MKHIKASNQKSRLKWGRCADRFDTALPVEIGGVRGMTRNISATGIYFETEVTQAPGARVSFTVEVVVRGRRTKLECEGDVVRVHDNGAVLGIATKLDKSFFADDAEVILQRYRE